MSYKLNILTMYLATLMTLIRFIYSMYPLMCYKVMFYILSLVTHIALIRFILRMCRLSYCMVTFKRKGIVTLITSISSISHMHHLMNKKGVFHSDFLPTKTKLPFIYLFKAMENFLMVY